ncbi:sarcoplasmic calcium-binding protein [Penaeus vannamei]|uniref:Sarcoplasmic calcium-binding protein n=1 Tax=Penaeus vannamei TaxID=6689 RepID=A0A423T8M2_PENVA|nr:sarcoplasmic calcium-binding protein [Penaeus vannamei]
MPDTTSHSQDGEVSVEEFKQAVQTHCKGKKYDAFPSAFKIFICNQFKTIDATRKQVRGRTEARGQAWQNRCEGDTTGESVEVTNAKSGYRRAKCSRSWAVQYCENHSGCLPLGLPWRGAGTKSKARRWASLSASLLRGKRGVAAEAESVGRTHCLRMRFEAFVFAFASMSGWLRPSAFCIFHTPFLCVYLSSFSAFLFLRPIPFRSSSV